MRIPVTQNKASKASKVPVKQAQPKVEPKMPTAVAIPPSGEQFIVISGEKGLGGFNGQLTAKVMHRCRNRYGLSCSHDIAMQNGKPVFDQKGQRDQFEKWVNGKASPKYTSFKRLAVVQDKRGPSSGWIATEFASVDKGHYRLRLFKAKKGWVATTRESSSLNGRCPVEELLGASL